MPIIADVGYAEQWYVQILKSIVIFAASMKMPVPQNSDPIANPHSAVVNPGSTWRIWKMPIAVSIP